MPPETKPKVLMIDDEKFLLDIYSTKFLKSGFDVFACHSVDEGLAILQKGYEPAVILFDITMPEKDGYVFLEGISQLHLKNMPLKIALTNEGQEGELKRMKELGTDIHLSKASFTPAEIVERVRSLLAGNKRS